MSLYVARRLISENTIMDEKIQVIVYYIERVERERK